MARILKLEGQISQILTIVTIKVFDTLLGLNGMTVRDLFEYRDMICFSDQLHSSYNGIPALLQP